MSDLRAAVAPIAAPDRDPARDRGHRQPAHPTVDDVVRVGDRFVVPGQSGVLYLVDGAGARQGRTTVDRRVVAVRQLAPNAVLAVGKGTLIALAVLTPPA